jgi:hypothetical protein
LVGVNSNNGTVDKSGETIINYCHNISVIFFSIYILRKNYFKIYLVYIIY